MSETTTDMFPFYDHEMEQQYDSFGDFLKDRQVVPDPRADDPPLSRVKRYELFFVDASSQTCAFETPVIRNMDVWTDTITIWYIHPYLEEVKEVVIPDYISVLKTIHQPINFHPTCDTPQSAYSSHILSGETLTTIRSRLIKFVCMQWLPPPLPTELDPVPKSMYCANPVLFGVLPGQHPDEVFNFLTNPKHNIAIGMKCALKARDALNHVAEMTPE